MSEPSSSLDTLSPGSLVSALVVKTVHNGAICQIHGLYHAQLDITHTDFVLDATDENSVRKYLKPGTHIKARILFILDDNDEDNSIRIGLSFQSHLIALKKPETESFQSIMDKKLESVVVKRVDPKLGLWCSLPTNNALTFFVHVPFCI